MKHSMTFAFFIVLFLALPLLTLHGQERDRPLAPTRQIRIHIRKEIAKPVEVRHLLYLPRGYEVDTSKRWPLLLFLHGSRERGDDFELVKRHGPPKLIEQGQNFKFIKDGYSAQAMRRNVQFMVYPDAEHDAWTETYNNPELHRWIFFQHRRQAE